MVYLQAYRIFVFCGCSTNGAFCLKYLKVCLTQSTRFCKMLSMGFDGYSVTSRKDFLTFLVLKNVWLKPLAKNSVTKKLLDPRFHISGYVSKLSFLLPNTHCCVSRKNEGIESEIMFGSLKGFLTYLPIREFICTCKRFIIIKSFEPFLI